jgi:hypothetical protein
LSGRIEQSFRERLTPLPPPTRLLLLVAEPIGDPVLVWRAAAELGVGPDAAAPATDAGLVDFGAQVRFRHPLVRSAVYRAGAPEERQDVHRALADKRHSSIRRAPLGTSVTWAPIRELRIACPTWLGHPAKRAAAVTLLGPQLRTTTRLAVGHLCLAVRPPT